MEFGQTNTVVYGLFVTRAALETAVGRLKADGFLSSDISALLPTVEGSEEFTVEKENSAVLGGALGWLAGIGILTIPGLGPFVAAGPILATLGGASGIAGAMTGMGIPKYQAKRFASAVSDGRMLLLVHAGYSESVEKADIIFKECGAHDVSSASGGEALFGSQSQDTVPEKLF